MLGGERDGEDAAVVTTSLSRCAMKVAVALSAERLVRAVPTMLCDNGNRNRGVAGSHDRNLFQAPTPENLRSPGPPLNARSSCRRDTKSSRANQTGLTSEFM